MRCPNISYQQHWYLQHLVNRPIIKETYYKDDIFYRIETYLHDESDHYLTTRTRNSLIKRGYVELVDTGKKTRDYKLPNRPEIPIIEIRITETGKQIVNDYNKFFDEYDKRKK